MIAIEGALQRWTATAGVCHYKARDLPEEQWAQQAGRCMLHPVRWMTARAATHPQPTPAQLQVLWWASLSHRLREQQAQWKKGRLRKFAHEIAAGNGKLAPPGGTSESIAWTVALSSVQLTTALFMYVTAAARTELQQWEDAVAKEDHDS